MNPIIKIFRSGYIQVLLERNFRRIWLAWLISQSGDIFYRVAIVWFVSQEMQSVVAVGAVVISSSLPILLFRLIGGAVSDWFDRRQIMVFSNLLQALLVLSLPLLYFAHVLSLALILIVTFSREVLNQFFQPARQALIPSIVPKASLGIANSLNSTSSFGVSATIPALVGVLIVVAGPVSAFFLDAASFVLSAALLFGLKLPASTQTENKRKLSLKSLLDNIIEGVIYLFQNPIIRVVAVINLISIFAFGPYSPISLLYFQNSLGMDSLQYGLTLSLGFFGLAMGTAIAGFWIKTLHPGRVYALGLAVMGGMTLAIGIMPSIWIVLVLNTARAFGNGLIVVSYTTLLQSQTEDAHLGRVFSNMTLINEGLRPVAVATGTAFAEFTSPQAVIVATSFFFISASLVGILNTNLREAGKKIS